MDTNNKKAGFFVFAGFVLLIAVLFIVSGNSSIFSSTYKLKVQLDQVQGLSQGSVVQLVGLPVGNVHSITFDAKGELVVILEINKSYQSRITKGSQAGLRTQGALGDKFVYITPGEAGSEVLQHKDYLLTEKGGDLFSTLREKGDQVSYLFEILEDTRNMVKDINGKGELKELIVNLKETSQSLKQFSGDINADRAGKKISQSLTKLDKILTKIDSGNGSLGAIINDPTLYNRINEWLGGNSSNPIKSAIRDSIQETEK